MRVLKILIPILVTIIVLAALVYFVYIPQTLNITLLWAENSLKTETVNELKAKVAALEEVKDQKDEVEDLLTRIAYFLPEKEEAGNFLIQTEALALETGNNLIDIRFREETTQSSRGTSPTGKEAPSEVKGESTTTPSSSSIKSMYYEINLDGSYPSLFEYLQKLEKLYRYNLVEKADMEILGDVGVKLFIKGSVYYQ